MNRHAALEAVALHVAGELADAARNHEIDMCPTARRRALELARELSEAARGLPLTCARNDPLLYLQLTADAAVGCRCQPSIKEVSDAGALASQA